ncbi:MAG: Fic family protein [Magnetococcales bacterium]|nr:Fic family protein [Magnetococcales bacterium]
MFLPALLTRARPLLLAHFQEKGPALPKSFPACTLFFSLSSGSSRARVCHASGDDFHIAWKTGSGLAIKLAKREKLKVKWLRIDWVTGVEAHTWGALNARLAETKCNYFRFAIALDAGFQRVFLEQELNANAMLDADGDAARVNEENFATYAAIRYGQNIGLDCSPEAPVFVLATAGLFLAVDGDLAALPGGREPQWLPGPGSVPGVAWSDPGCLNSGRRPVASLGPDELFALIDSGANFLARQVQKNGQFIYGHFPCFGKKVASYNALRHASSLYAMLESWELTRRAPLLAAIHRALSSLTTHLIRGYTLPGGESVAFVVDTGEEIKLGANAVSILALVKYTELTGDRQYLPLMGRLALGIVHMQDGESGRFVHVLNAADLTVKEAFRIIYYDGEAAFGLMRLYGLTQDPRWLAAVRKGFDYFLRADHWKAHDHWLAYCVNELTRHLPEERYFLFGVQNIADFLDFILQRETTYPTLLELAMAFEQMLGRVAADPERQAVLRGLDVEKFWRALHHRAHYLLNGFFWPEMAMYFARPAGIVGSFCIRHHGFRVRIDDIEHYLSGYVAYWKFLRNGQARMAESVPEPEPETVPVADPSPLWEPGDFLRRRWGESRGNSLHLLRRFDAAQLFRLFVDGRFHKKYDGWVGYEAGERGSVQALLNGLVHMLDHFDLRAGLESTYLLDLHKVCMMGVQTRNLKSSPGDLRHLNAGMPFLAKSTTLENLREVFDMRRGDGTAVFNNKAFAKPAEELDPEEVYRVIHRDGKLNYRNWYPNLGEAQQRALEKKSGLQPYYEAKHQVQMQFARRVDEIVERFNASMGAASTPAQRLRAIALVVRELELLHPFPDGNCRTVACVLLTQLLLNYGFTPALLENPNLDGECSLDQWIGEIRKGMELFEVLLQNPQARVYNYAIQDAAPENRQRFAEMSREVVARIQATNPLFLTPQRLTAWIPGEWLRPCPADLRFTGIGTYNTYARGNLYFAMEIKAWKKEGRNIRESLAAILAKEQRALVIDDREIGEGWEVPVLLVEDGFAAFKSVAMRVRRELDPLTLLITGTEGKTGAKVQLHHLLNWQTSVHAVLNSANTEVPVLRSLANLGADHRVEINEVSVGADEAYRVERARMVEPDLCLFTNIGPNHMDLHKSLENLLRAKSSVVEGLRDGGVCIVNRDNALCAELVAAIRQRKPEATILTYGSGPEDHARLLGADFDPQRLGWRVHARVVTESVDYFLPLPQQHAPLASVGVLLAVHCAGFDVNRAARDYASLQPYETMGRLLRLNKNGGEVLFYDQSRRGGISGMRSAFADLVNFPVQGRVVALVGGVSVLHDSDWTREVHGQLAELINASPIDRLYTTGNYMRHVHEKLDQPPVKHSDDLDELALQLVEEVQPGDLLFIIGSAYLYLGRVAERITGMLVKGEAPPAVALGGSPHASAYRLLKVYEEVAKGGGPVIASAANGVAYAAFQKAREEIPDYTTCRARLLEGFFAGLPELFSRVGPLRCVDDELKKTSLKGHVVTPDYCVQWFNNQDKNANLPAKQCFGSFFDFGDREHLLHVEVATVNLHIGLVLAPRTPAGFASEVMHTCHFDEIRHRWPELIDFGLARRSWGPKWASVDLGSLIAVTRPEVFLTLVDLAASPLFVERIAPFLRVVAKR